MSEVQHVFLSRRNLTALLNKLDRKKAGEHTNCTIIKNQSPSPNFRQTANTVVVVAVDDEEYYSAQQRSASAMHPTDERNLGVPSTGVEPIPTWMTP